MYTTKPWVKDQSKELSRFKIFEYLIPFAPNETWKKIIVDFSNGILPKYFKYDGENLMHVRGDKVKAIRVNTIPTTAEEAIVLLNSIMKFIEECINFVVRDTEEESKILDMWSRSILPTKWSEVRRQNIKEKYIADYVDYISKFYGIISKSVRYSIYEKLICAIAQGWISPTDILIDNGRITMINGVVYDPEKKDIIVHISKRKYKSSSVKKIEKEPPLDKKWGKYLTTLKGDSSKRGKSSDGTTSTTSV